MKKGTLIFGILLAATLLAQYVDAFEIDLSRRRRQIQKSETGGPAGNQRNVGTAFIDLFTNSEPSQEYVILNTDHGFIPNKVSLRKGGRYTVHLVNVNDKEKNVSFVLDAFSEHHATYYGKIKSFELKPAQEGVFSFTCPETGAEGRVIVFAPPSDQGTVRNPASAHKPDAKE